MMGMKTIPRLAVTACLLLAGACGGGGGGGPAGLRDGLLDTALPDLTGTQQFAQAQLRTREDALARALDAPATSAAELARTFGEVGQILLAAGYRDAAEPYLRNAMTLAPAEIRWPYYLGHMHRQRGDAASAVALFEAARDLGRDAATRLWLGDLYRELGRPADAVDAYTEALVADPGATAAHEGLALAYRELGDEAQATAQLDELGTQAARRPDPLMDELPRLLQTAQAFENRAFLAANEGDWEEAIAQFQQAAALSPGDRSMQMNLGTALLNIGDGAGARQAFLAAERADPQNPDTQYALGALYLMAGQYRSAIERFELAAAIDPGMAEAFLSLADTLRQDGRPAAALPVYVELLAADENFAAAQFGVAASLVQLERWDEALATFLDGVERYPNDPRFAHAAARLLVASPDDRVRNGLLALEIMSVLVETQPTNIEVGETMAMTMAENEIWVDALNWQRGTIEGARAGGTSVARLGWLTSNLARYERSEPARTPWPPDHAIFQPGGPPQPDLLP